MSSLPPESAKASLPLFWKLFAFAAVIAIGTFAAQFAALLIKAGTRISETIWHPVLMVAVVLLVSRVFLRVFEGRTLRAIGVGRDGPWIRQAALGVALGTMMVTLVWLGMVVAGATWQLGSELRSRGLQFVLGAVLAAGIGAYEELLCRGYAMQLLYRWKPAAGIIVPGLYFVAIHLPQPGGTAPLTILNMFLGHVLYVICFLRTRNLWTCIGIHAAWNFCLAFVFGLPISGRTAKSTVIATEASASLLFGGSFGAESGLLVTAVLVLGTALLWKFLPQRHGASGLIDGAADGAEAPVVARPVSSATPAPTALGPRLDRFPALDVLRALSLFGILTMNVQGFALHDAAVLNPYACAWTDAPNLIVWTVTSALFGRKDLMLFAMMFGAGIVMIADRAVAAGRNALHLHVQRTGALLMIALVHAYLIWSGDILFTYAVCGLLVFPLRNSTPRRMISTGIVLFLVPMVLLVAVQLALPLFSEEARHGIYAVFHPGAEVLQEHYDTYRLGWWAQMPARVSAALVQHTLLLLVMGWIAAGMMLVGMGLYRLGYLSGQSAPRRNLRLLLATGIAGLLLTAFGFWINYEKEWRPEFSFFIGRLPIELGAPLLAVATVALVMVLFGQRDKSRLVRSLAAMGRMSLTHYLSQSIVLTFLFYGTGLGWIGTMDRVGQLGVVVALWAAQWAVSPLWLAHFRFGPAEWLWRSMAYVQRQPMRRSGAATGGDA